MTTLIRFTFFNQQAISTVGKFERSQNRKIEIVVGMIFNDIRKTFGFSPPLLVVHCFSNK